MLVVASYEKTTELTLFRPNTEPTRATSRHDPIAYATVQIVATL